MVLANCVLIKFILLVTPHPNTHKVEPTEMCIDYDKLRQQEKIFFYDDVLLFEDELADNGSAMLRVKIVRAPAH